MHIRSRLPTIRHAAVSIATFCLLALSHGAAAVPLDDWATGATTAVYDCTGVSALLCALTPVSVIDGPEGGGVMQSSASSTIDNPSLGNARAHAELNPATGLAIPVLKAESFSDSVNGGAAASAFAVEAYTNTSGSTQSYALDFLLDAVMVKDETTPLDLGTTVVAGGFVVKADSGLYSFSSDFETVIGNLLLQSVITLELIATDLLIARPNDGAPQDLQDTVNFDLADGESAYVLAFLTAQAMRDGSSADAFSTLTVEFQDPIGLVSASNSGSTEVPEPGSLGLMALGAILTLAARRSRRRVSTAP
ncbi:MAG: PEP-CTERM sorting domain-containing protein [Gammaproteobacteria bacterium]|nr:PEP-CTERM sorting domain-containing protein [Gammaproteobacteria bacterium]